MKHGTRLSRTFVLITAIALPPASALAQNLNDDAKCFVVSNLFSKTGDAKSKEAASKASFFYLGRMRGSEAEIEAAIAAQAPLVTAAAAPAIMSECAKTVEQRGTEVQAIGRRLAQRQEK